MTPLSSKDLYRSHLITSDQKGNLKLKDISLADMGVFFTDQLHKTWIAQRVGRQHSYKGCFTTWLRLFHLQVPQATSLIPANSCPISIYLFIVCCLVFFEV